MRRLTPKGREAMVRRVVEGGLIEGGAARQFNTTPKTVAKWVERSAPRASMVCGPLLATAFIAKPNVAGRMRGRRGFAPAAPHRRADRRRGRRFAGHRQPHPAGGWASTGCRRWSRPSRSAAMSASTPARSIHIDIKKLGKFNRIGHRITGDRRGQSNTPRGRLGIRACLRSTTTPASPSPRSCRTRRSDSASAFLQRRCRLLTQASASRSSAS